MTAINRVSSRRKHLDHAFPAHRLRKASVDGDVAVFERQIIPAQTGRLGYAIRVSPNHYDDPLTRPVTSLLKWGAR